MDIFSLDLPSVVIAFVACCIVILIFYLVYKFSIREKSFEEVLEEQNKRRIEEEEQQQLQKSEKTKKEKHKKKWHKKGKEKSEPQLPKEFSTVQEDVAHEIEIIEPKQAKQPKRKGKGKGKSGHIVNDPPSESGKTSKSVTQNVSVAEKDKEEKKDILEPVKDKGKLELKQEVPVPAVQPKDVGKNVQKPISSVNVSAGTSAAPSKKKKKENTDTVDVTSLSSAKLLSLIREAELDTEESQTLIDILLNKQKDSTGWTKKHDQLAIAKKHLHEKEQLLEHEQRQLKSTTAKCKELRDEINSLKTKSAVQERIGQGKVNAQKQEIHSLTIRLKQTQDQLTIEQEKVAQIDEIGAALVEAEEEKEDLLETISTLETSICSSVPMAELAKLRKEYEDLKTVHEHIITAHKAESQSLNTQVKDGKVKFEDLSAKYDEVSKDLKTHNDNKAAFDALEQKLTSEAASLSSRNILQGKLEESTLRYAELEAQVKQMADQMKELDSKNVKLAEEQTLEVQKDEEIDQLTAVGDAEGIVHNGNVNGKAQRESRLVLLEEKDKLIQEKDVVLAQLNEDLIMERAKIANLNKDIQLEKEKNNELREKNWTAVSALKMLEKASEEKEIKLTTGFEEQAAEARQEFEKQLNDLSIAAQKCLPDEVVDKIQETENLAEERLSNYMNEVEKNKYLTSEVERISASQETTELRVSAMVKTVEDVKLELLNSESKTMKSLQRIFPEITIDDTLAYDSWLKEFENQAGFAMKATSLSHNAELQARLAIYEEEVQAKENIIQGYEKVLCDTESKLLNVQKSAEVNEALLQEAMVQRDEQLKQNVIITDAVVADKDAIVSTVQQLDEMQNNLESLQSSLVEAESGKSYLEQRCEELRMNIMNLRDQVDDKEKIILELLQKESHTSESLKREIEDVKSKFEKERKISKDFSSQMIKLNSLVNIGQDALAAEQLLTKKLKSELETEQGLNKKLQSQLENEQTTTANGTSTVSSPIVKNNESQPKVKSSQKSKKKMDASDEK